MTAGVVDGGRDAGMCGRRVARGAEVDRKAREELAAVDIGDQNFGGHVPAQRAVRPGDQLQLVAKWLP